MSGAGISTNQRARRAHPCVICGGHKELPPHRGIRCWGHATSDGRWYICVRPERSGTLLPNANGQFAHLLAGDCPCGITHDGSAVQNAPTDLHWLKSRPERIAEARAVWRRAQPLEATLAAKYLESRALEGPYPPTLRFIPRLPHGPSRQELPSLIAAVERWPASQVVAISRTWLRWDGSGKANVDPPRMFLAPTAGGAVRLAPAETSLALAEGVETALSVQHATGLPTWAVLSAVGFPKLILPPLPLACDLTLAIDNDDAGESRRAAHQAAERFIAEGRRVRFAIPPSGTDWNDVLRQRAT